MLYLPNQPKKGSAKPLQMATCKTEIYIDFQSFRSDYEAPSPTERKIVDEKKKK